MSKPLLTSLAFVLLACGEQHVEGVPSEAVLGDSTPVPTVDEEQEAVRIAEAFVRAQGYTASPPTVTEDEIVRESIEESFADRRNTLTPQAVSVSRQGERWMVMFSYVDPQYAGRGRALIVEADGAAHFVHQDRVLSVD